MKYYNFCLFHSVQHNFLAQTGDPSGVGSGGESIYGWVFKNMCIGYNMCFYCRFLGIHFFLSNLKIKEGLFIIVGREEVGCKSKKSCDSNLRIKIVCGMLIFDYLYDNKRWESISLILWLWYWL